MVSKLALNLTACALVLSGISVAYPSNAAPAKKPVAKRAVAPIKKPSPAQVLATHLVLNSLAPGANIAEACRRADFKSLATALSMNADLLHQEKGEYETSDQFAVRVSRLASALGGNETIFCQPLNDNEDLPFVYDADTEKFEASFDKNQNVWRDVKQLGSYRTTTRMGVPLTVKASVEFEYNASLTIPKPDESCGASASYPFNYRFTVPASLSEAPILKARGYVAFVGKLVPPYVTEEQNSGSPSLDDPNDIQTVNRTVSLKTTRIILVNGAGKELWSCNLGLPPAQEEYDLADREYNIGNFVAAVRHYQKAASLGNPAAFSSLGYMYGAGEGLPEDKLKALYWYRKSAEAGNVRAQYLVADIYLNGLGIEKDPAQAAVWYRKAADAGDTEALYALGTLYRTGEGVSKDDAQAFGFHRKAAERGDIRAIAAVFKAYADGDGVAKDPVISQFWQHKIKGHGSIGASFLPQLQGSQYIGDMIGQVLASSSAMKAGLKPKDVILSVNGIALTQDRGAGDLIYNSLPGDVVKLEVLEYPIGTKKLLSLNLEKDVTYTSGPPSRALLGVGPVPLPNSDAQVLGLPAGTGEIISSVRDNSPASQSGMRIGDIVLAVNGLPVTTERTLTALIATFNASSTIKIEILRNRNEIITLGVTLARWP